MRLLADKAVELDLVESISHTQVQNILKKRTSAAFEENVVHWQDGRFVYFPNGENSLALCSAIEGRISRPLF